MGLYTFKAALMKPTFIVKNPNVFFTLPIRFDVHDNIVGQDFPMVSTSKLPDMDPTGRPLQAFVSPSVLNAFEWLFINQQIHKALKNSDLPKDVPLQLNTSYIDVLIPTMSKKYGPNLGVFLNVGLLNTDPDISIKDGRLVTLLHVELEFIVDTNSSQYNNETYTLETCQESQWCESSIRLNASFFASLNLYNVNETTIGARVINLQIMELNVIEKKIDDFEVGKLQTFLNSMVGQMVPDINSKIASGFANPIIGKYMISAMDVNFNVDYIGLSLGLGAKP